MTNKVEKLIGSQIAKIRKERGLTQAQVAELVNVATETISRLERGVSIPSLKRLEKIGQALNTPMKIFFDFDYSPKGKAPTFENELTKVDTFLRTKRIEDIRLSYKILRKIFEQIEQNYKPKKVLPQKMKVRGQK